jgi:hypothetical protein
MRWLLLVGALGLFGCDTVLGLDDPSLPRCLPKKFTNARTQVLRTEIEAFSFTKDRALGVASIRGINSEVTKDGDPMPLPLQPMYSMMSVAMEPNGDYILFTAGNEPPEILAARPMGDSWVFDKNVPKGYIAGTPSDRMTGDPVRVIVRLFAVTETGMKDFAEYERTAEGTWIEVNERFTIRAAAGANLTPDGLAIVYDGYEDGDDKRGVYVRQRASLDESFGGDRASELIFDGTHTFPQLFGDCTSLYTVDDATGENALTWYEI